LPGRFRQDYRDVQDIPHPASFREQSHWYLEPNAHFIPNKKDSQIAVSVGEEIAIIEPLCGLFFRARKVYNPNFRKSNCFSFFQPELNVLEPWLSHLQVQLTDRSVIYLYTLKRENWHYGPNRISEPINKGGKSTMNSIKFIMALAAICMLVMPAFSMLDSGIGQDCKQKMWQGQDDKQKSCDCQKSMMGQDDERKICQSQDDKQMMWQGKENTCDCQKPCDCQKSMMGSDDKQKMWQGKDDEQKSCGCQKSMMGQDDKRKMCQSQDDKQMMWQGKENTCDCQKPCDCQKSMMGQNDEHKMCFGQDGKQKECVCQKSMMGPEGKHIKSMMGDRDGNGKVMIVVVKR
jgi:hypothetical protein